MQKVREGQGRVEAIPMINKKVPTTSVSVCGQNFFVIYFPRDITCGKINPLDKYPLSLIAPRIMDFITEEFSKPRFAPSEHEGQEDYTTKGISYRVSRLK